MMSTNDQNPNRNEYDLGDHEEANLPPVKTLQVNGCMNLSRRDEAECLFLFRDFKWSSMEKLALASDFLTEVLLPRIADRLIKLRSLRISVYPSPGEGIWVASQETLRALSGFLSTKPLVELELDGFTKDVPMRLIASPQLRKLRLHSWEIDPAVAQANLRSAQDIRELAELAPNLEHLMLDVAHVGKLWHPTAIPGVDVDVHLYQVLDALCKFSRLKILHLFPRYSSPHEDVHGLWKQALEDDGQAVQIFKHLKAIQPSLELLILSSDNIVARFSDIDPMTWTVCQLGDSILLRVRQANKDYEQKQIWHGQRRLRTEIKRYSYSKPYLDGVGPRIGRRGQV
jgi:hypothetical protein